MKRAADREGGKVQHCEQCGAELPLGPGEIACLPCLLRGGMEAEAADAATAPPDFGTRSFHHYEVLTRADGSPWELGRGAMGVTYKALDVNLRSPVALKVLNGRISAQPGGRQRFLREAQAAAQLRHPNVASVFHFGVVNALPSAEGAAIRGSAEEQIEEGDCFFAMEFVEGETLEARLRREGPLSAELALEIALQVARALAAAERHDLVHRDLKPANILLLPQEEMATNAAWVKVIDFGLAQGPAEAEGAPQFLGTLEFASPEQRQGKRLDMRSDIFSLGRTIAYALTGEIAPVLPLTPPEGRDIPAPLLRLLESMLAEDPEERPASARALVQDLQGLLDQRTVSQAAVAPERARFRRSTLVLALGVAAALAAFIYFLLAPAPLVDDKSIAVLPFRNLSSAPENAFFAEGIEDDLLSSLVKIRDLKVIGRLSTARYPPTASRDFRAIGRALGVRHLLQGSLRRTGDRVLLQAELIDTHDGQTVWAERYDRKVADAIQLQGELASAIVAALDAQLSPREKSEIRSLSTGNPDAYLLYLRGRKLENRPATAIADYEAAEALYRQALALDPGFAKAHARLASSLALLYRYRGPSEELKERAHAEAREALRLAPGLGEAHLALGLCFYRIERDFDRALSELLIAQRLLPNDLEPESYIAYMHRRQGKWRAARSELERVVARDPSALVPAEELFATAVLLRDWPAAEKYGNRLLTIESGLAQVRVERAYVDLWSKGDLAPARRVLADLENYGDKEGDTTWARWDAAMIDRDFVGAKAALDRFPLETLPSVFSAPLPKSYLLGCVRLAQGDRAGAQELFESARPALEAEALEHPQDSLRHARLGLLYAYMGRKTEAIREGERAVHLRPVSQDDYDGPERLCNLALIHARVGDSDQALAMIRSLLQKPGCVSFYEASLTLSELRLRWQWDPLRSDPGFQKILASAEPATIY